MQKCADYQNGTQSPKQLTLFHKLLIEMISMHGVKESPGSYDLTGGSKLDKKNICRGGAKFRMALGPLVSLRDKT